jgi:predicted nucleotidyltransferase component of viral defense system
MRISREQLSMEAAATGFRPEVLEKVLHLLTLLEGFRRHPFLQGRLALKGGTALNLFVFELPRLSVDIDLNYIGTPERQVMLAERPRVEEAIRAVCAREGLVIRRYPGDHAGGRWALRYASALGQGGNLEVDLNFMFRVPLWPIVTRDSYPVGSYRATGVPLLDAHELAAGKLVALLARRAARDLFDAQQLLSRSQLDHERLRVGFVIYGAMQRQDWRTIAVHDLRFTPGELVNHLLPLLRRTALAPEETPAAWAGRLIEECCQALQIVLPLRPTEVAFLDRLLDDGEIMPTLLTGDAKLAERISQHPMLAWKALNVRRHKEQ